MRLLSLVTLGRIGFTSGALPTVLPIDFSLDCDRILVRTARGSTFGAALRDAVVGFEADIVDPVSRLGWSVAVTGVANEVSDPELLDAAHETSIPRWAPPGDEMVLAISTEFVSGRRVTTDRPRSR